MVGDKVSSGRRTEASAGSVFTPRLSPATLKLLGKRIGSTGHSIFSRLFGGKSLPPGSEPVVYKGFAIVPDPICEGSRYRVAAQIEKEVGGEKRTHTMIRSDVLEDRDSAAEVSTAKAKQMIDEQGERLFD